MEEEPKTISRSDLYRQVWKTPITRLSKEYGLSDVGLAKICKKHDIPRPPRGYWARKAGGWKVTKEPLPRRSSDELIRITPNPANRSTSHADPQFLQHVEQQKDFPPIVVSKSLRSPHPFVAQAAEILELSEPDDIGILEPKEEGCLDIRVSRKSLRRALRILDALIKGLTARGFEVFREDDSLKVRIHGETLGIGISEEVISRKTQPKDPDLSGSYHFGHSRFDYVRVPSDKLCLTIHDRRFFWSDNFRKNWRDTERKSLEDSLNAFVMGLIKRAAKKKEYRLQEEEEERRRREIARRREEEERRRAELERQIRNEQARVAGLVTDAQNYHKSRQIRDFIAAVGNERMKGNQIYVSDEDHDAWVKWARDQADRLDPLTESPASILDIDVDEDDE